MLSKNRRHLMVNRENCSKLLSVKQKPESLPLSEQSDKK
jgi:hypothetical protein